MPEPQPLPINPPPGVVLTETDKVVVGRFTGSNMMRFIRGQAEKRGGWVVLTTEPTLGQPRALHPWRDNSGNQYFAVGTFEKLYVYDTGMVQNDITPFSIGISGPLTLGNNPLSTQAGQPTVTVNLPSHGLLPGGFVYIAGAVAIGGITPNGSFNVVSVIDANNFTYNFTSNATGTVAGGGGAAVTLQAEINIGTELGAFGYGWGIGGWGLGTWGTPRTNSTISIEPRVWSLDHFGKLLMATYNGGSVYQFDPTQVQPWPRAQIVSADAPTDCRALFVTPEEFVIALRANMVVAGCNQGDPTTWTPATNNTAFQRTLTIGTKLIAGRVLAPFNSLIWSDSAVYLLQYTGDAFVYSTSLLGAKCGLIAPGAAVTAGGIAYWMTPDNFWMYDGSVHVIPNTEDVRKYVFNAVTGLNVNNSYQCYSVYNPKQNEIEFFYTVIGQSMPTMSVTFSIDNQAWAPHTNWPDGICRCSGASPDSGDTRPVMAGTDGLLYQHENGVDANGSPLPYSLTLARWSMEQGFKISQIQGFEPDFEIMAATMSITFSAYDRLYDGTVQAEPLETETDIITTAESYIEPDRITARYLGITFFSNDLGSNMRFGQPVAWVKPVGIRP
jgi:hypothetical protein